MRQRHVWFGAALVLAASAVPALATPQFKILATVPAGCPAVGAVHGGVIYGTQNSCGSSSGYIFAFNIVTRQFSDIHDFNVSLEGSRPNPGLAVDASGNLFGTAAIGGNTNNGTIFKLDTNHVLTVLHNFGSGSDSAQPRQGLVRIASNGTLIGAGRIAAINNDGNIFQLKADGTYAAFHNFLNAPDEGHCPYGGVTRDSHGNVYGTTWGGGSGGNPLGSVFKISPQGVFTTLYAFKNQTDGEFPDMPPTVDKAGNVYGVSRTQNGGGYAGAIWKIDTQGNFSLLHVLNGTANGSTDDGYLPNSPLVLGADGNLYGTTLQGGIGFGGVLFQITPSGTYTVIHRFTGGADGSVPSGSLVVSGKKIFGSTYSTIFQYHL